MCQMINAACLMANVFDVCTTREVFPLSDMGRIGDRVEGALRNRNVAVDWTRPSVMEAFDLYSDLFVMGNGQVRKSPRFAVFSASRFIADEFNHSLPDDVVQTMRQTIHLTCVAT